MKRTLRCIGSMLSLLIVAWCAPVHAHHSTIATYNTRERVEIKGVIVDFQFRNPHSFIHVQAPDAGGTLQRWAIECAGIGALASEHVTARSMRPGDAVIIQGFPGRDPADHRLLLTSIERPSDGWKWMPRWARPAGS